SYPDRNVPTVLVYSDGDLKANIVGVERFGGSLGMTLENVEIVLSGIGAVAPPSSHARKDSDDEEESRPKGFRMASKSQKHNVAGDDDWD
ncbi:hypothetical protein HDV03_001974, partial [Kappamyces sp. JEL0829]